MSRRLAEIDWTVPWLSPYRDVGLPLAQQAIAGEPVFEVLDACTTSPVRFVEQSQIPEGMAYEEYIFNSRSVPTRNGLHDFLNGLIWLHFPSTKQHLNQLQATQISTTGILPVRGPVRDGITVFDENAALLRAPDAVWEALRAKDWRHLFVDLRPLWEKSWLVLFGHALLEKLVQPRKPITAHVYRVYPETDSMLDLDRWVAQDLSAEKLSSKPFVPLPVLGMPGWWPANEKPAFYEDTQVFRPLR